VVLNVRIVVPNVDVLDREHRRHFFKDILSEDRSGGELLK
jgi:hypothetical protein